MRMAHGGRRLIDCIHCGELISRDAEECPHCGAKLVAATASDWRDLSSGCGCGFLLMLALLGYLADEYLFRGAGTVVIVLIVVAVVFALVDSIVKKTTGRSLIERIERKGR